MMVSSGPRAKQDAYGILSLFWVKSQIWGHFGSNFKIEANYANLISNEVHLKSLCQCHSRSPEVKNRKIMSQILFFYDRIIKGYWWTNHFEWSERPNGCWAAIFQRFLTYDDFFDPDTNYSKKHVKSFIFRYNLPSFQKYWNLIFFPYFVSILKFDQKWPQICNLSQNHAIIL